VEEFALYKGEDLLFIGTIQEIAEHRNVKVESDRYNLTPAYQKRIDKRKNARNYLTLTRLED